MSEGIEVAWDQEIDTKSVRGEAGESLIANRLAKLDSSFIVFNNITICNNKNQSAQLDHLVLSKKGIFCIETKNWSGEIYGGHDDAFWTQVAGSGEYKIINPILQNKRHIDILQSILQKMMMRKLKYYSVICFVGDAEPPWIKQDDFVYIGKSGIVKYITKQEDILTNDTVKVIASYIHNSIIKNKEYK